MEPVYQEIQTQFNQRVEEELAKFVQEESNHQMEQLKCEEKIEETDNDQRPHQEAEN